MIDHIWFARLSRCIKKKSEMYNVNTDVIFYVTFDFIKAIKNIYLIKILLHRYFSRILLRCSKHRCGPLSMAVSKIAYLTHKTFCLGLLRPFAVSFYPCMTEEHIPETFCFLKSCCHFFIFLKFYLILPFLLYQI